MPTSNFQPADIVLGQSDFVTGSSAASATASSLHYPYAVFVLNGQLFVADYSNDRVLIYNQLPTSSGAPADVVIGQTRLCPQCSPMTTTRMAPWMPIRPREPFSTPSGVYVKDRQLFVTDEFNNRVLIFNAL